MAVTSELLSNCINKYENNCPQSVKIIVGDLNGCNFHDQIPSYEQYVKCTVGHRNSFTLLWFGGLITTGKFITILHQHETFLVMLFC